MSIPVAISAAVEGLIDEAVARKLISHAGGIPATVYGKSGKTLLRQRIDGYNHAARRLPWMVLVDLDHDANCAPPLREQWLPKPARKLCFRIAVREVEAWLIADTESFASFIGLAAGKIPVEPETLDNPKRTVVNLARSARSRAVRMDMVPREGSGREVGPAYSSRMVECVDTRWRPDVAAKRSASLRGAVDCLRRLVEGGTTS